MKIQHGNNFYYVYIKMISTSNFSNCVHFDDKKDFDEMLSLEYPDIDTNKFTEYYDKLVIKLSEYASTTNPFKMDFYENYLYVGIVNNKLIFGRYQQTVTDRMKDELKRYNSLLDGLICKIDCYGWEVMKHENGITKVNYFSIASNEEEGRHKFCIYVYKDYLILGNCDEDKPTIVSNKYFLYNFGKRKKE